MAKVEKKLLKEIVRMALCKNKELKNCWIIKVRSVSGNCEQVGSKIGRQKLAEMEEQIFGGDCPDGCIYK